MHMLHMYHGARRNTSANKAETRSRTIPNHIDGRHGVAGNRDDTLQVGGWADFDDAARSMQRGEAFVWIVKREVV